jgi:hypothetical protein
MKQNRNILVTLFCEIVSNKLKLNTLRVLRIHKHYVFRK